MPEFDITSFNFFTQQLPDVYQSVADVMQSPISTHPADPTYGFPIDSWTQIIQNSRADFESRVRTAIVRDWRINADDITFEYTINHVYVRVGVDVIYGMRF